MFTVMVIIILFAGALVAIGSLTPGTTGIALIAIGCFLAIVARIVQAADQHADLLAALGHPKAAGRRVY